MKYKITARFDKQFRSKGSVFHVNTPDEVATIIRQVLANGAMSVSVERVLA